MFISAQMIVYLKSKLAKKNETLWKLNNWLSPESFV